MILQREVNSLNQAAAAALEADRFSIIVNKNADEAR